MRSCSYPDVMENQEDNKPPPIRISAQVNSAPQDFVVVKGGHSAGQSVVSAYKVSKSSASQPMLSPRPPTQPTENPLESFDPTRLRAELSLKTKEEVIEEVVEAKRALLRQEVEIKRLKRHLWVAEGAGGGLGEQPILLDTFYVMFHTVICCHSCFSICHEVIGAPQTPTMPRVSFTGVGSGFAPPCKRLAL